MGFRSPRIAGYTHQIGSSTCHIRPGKLSCTRNSLKSQFLMMISLICFHLSLSLPLPKNTKLSHHLSMEWSWVNTEYSIHRVQHTPSTAYSKQSIHQGLHTPSTASSEARLPPAPTQSLLSRRTILYSTLYIPMITCYQMNRVSAASPPPSLAIYRLRIDHLQVLIQSRSMMASKCISEQARWQPPSASLSYTISASKCISTLAWSWPPRASRGSLSHDRQVHFQTQPITASKSAWSNPPTASPNPLDYSHQMHPCVQRDPGLQAHP